MRRLLVVGSQWPRLSHVDWVEWESVNILDYQGLVLDLSAGPNIPSEHSLRSKLNEFLGPGHEVFLFLPHADRIQAGGSSLGFIPGLAVSLVREPGKTLRELNTDVFWGSYMQAIDGHEIVIANQHYSGSARLSPGIVNNVSKTVCGKYLSVFLLHPPSSGKEQKAREIILQYFGPDYEIPEPEPIPEWGQQVIQSLPGFQQCKCEIDRIEEQIRELRESKMSQVQQANDIAKWAGLLWMGGTLLQGLVNEALCLLGFPCSSSDPTGHAEDIKASIHGYDFIIEVTGSKGSIGIEKGRQLAQWVASAPSAITAKGVLIASGNKEVPLDHRPPSTDYQTFVRELQDYAKRFHLALLDIRELFDLVVAKLAGRAIDVKQLCKELAGDGVLRLSRP